MKTYYLLLRGFGDDKPLLIKACQANNKIEAERIFLDDLKNTLNINFFTEEELEAFIKEDNQLDKREQEWILEDLGNEFVQEVRK